MLFWVALVVFAVLGFVAHHLDARRALLVLTGVSFLGVLALTMTPSGDGGNGTFCTVQFSVPFQGIVTLANVALLVPLTLFAGLATGRPVAVVAVASGLSAAIELTQALLPTLGRACDTDDWLMNTTGAVVGGVLAVGITIGTRRTRGSAVRSSG